MSEFILRVRQSTLAILITTTIAICTLWQGALYPFGLASKPSGRRMTSTFIGEAASNGHRWGMVLSAIVDWVFDALGDGPNHCERTYLKYGKYDD